MTLHTNLFKQEGLDISVENVVKTYRTGEETHQALQGVTCDVNRGTVMIIQGPSGCGKTTFLNLLGGIDRSDSGKIQVGNWQLNGNITERDLARYRLEEVGFIFQAFNLIPGLNALDNLQLPMTVSGMKHRDRVERAHALLKLVDLDKKALKRPDELSGGEQQRVAAALALGALPPGGGWFHFPGVQPDPRAQRVGQSTAPYDGIRNEASRPSRARPRPAEACRFGQESSEAP